LLDQNNLGGHWRQSRGPTHLAGATPHGTGGLFDEGLHVALQGPGVSCPAPASDHQLTVLKNSVGDRPTPMQAWSCKVSGAGSPIVTTSDGSSDPVVWMIGTEGDNRLHGFKGDTGEPLLPAGAGPIMVGFVISKP
jgi:hypothetical protein